MKWSTAKVYNWQFYEMIILGFSSALGWLPIVWVFFFSVFLYLPSEPFQSYEVLLWVFFGVFWVLHIIIFGVFAYIFPKIYILPTYVINFVGLVLSVKQVVISLVDPYDPNSLNYSQFIDNYYIFSIEKVYLAIFELLCLIILFRPTLFYSRRVMKHISKRC